MTEDKEYGYASVATESEEVDVVTVRFAIEGGRVIGRVAEDARRPMRTKIVFPARSWIGPMPVQGEQIRVLVVHETKREDPARGALFVERIIPPARWAGGQYARCSACQRWDVPATDFHVIRRNGPFVAGRTVLRQTSACESCGVLHRIPTV